MPELLLLGLLAVVVLAVGGGVWVTVIAAAMESGARPADSDRNLP